MNIIKNGSQKFSQIKNWFSKTSLLIKFIIILLIVGIGWFSYTSFFKQNTIEPQIQTAQVKKGNIIATVSASGQVTSSNNANVNTQATGVVNTIYAENGQYVNSGDPIADLTLDQASQQRYTQALSSYQSAQNAVTSAQTRQLTLQAAMFQTWDQFKELAENSTYTNSDGSYNYTNRALPEFHIPEKEWLAAEAEYKTQEKVIAQAQTSLSAAWLSLQQSSPTIYAPISGTVSGLTLQVGSVISSTAGSSDSSTITSQKIASITTQASPMISVNLTEIDVLNITVGDKVAVTFDALIDKTYTGKVISIDTIGSVTSGVTNYPTLIALDDDSVTILSNMSASANITTDTKNNVLVVPVSAVQSTDEKSFVRVQKNGQIKQVPVVTGIASDTDIEIISGLTEGDTVITGNVSSASAAGGQSAFSSGFGGGGGGTMRIAR